MRVRDSVRLAKYRLLRHLPGDIGIHYTSRWRRGTDATARAFSAAVAGASGRTCVDLGANVGDVTRRMAGAGARVIAFEPDPWTAATLRENTRDLADLEIVEAAAGLSDGMVSVYRHRDFNDDPVRASESTTVYAEHGDVDPEAGTPVRQIDFPAWLSALDADVHILKIDIEGAEVPLIEALLEDRRLLSRIGFIFAEMHDWAIPSMAARVLALRRRTRRTAHPVIDLDWW